jgi:4-amino-4-deoxy-L-arabinose transferase-like glycosyltransferase
MKDLIRRHPLAAVFAFVTVCVLPMMILRDPSPSNELRYLSIVEEALEGGHFFCFYNQGIPYTDKPPLFFWLLMFFRLFCSSTCMWLPILFTALIPSFVTVAVMDRWLRLASSGQSTLWRVASAAFFLAGMLVMIQTFFLRMDMLMTMFIILALFTFWKMYTGRDVRKADRWLLPLYIFLALFTKGPVGFFAPVLIIVAFLTLEKSLRRLPEFLGWRQWLVMLLLFGGWILGAWLEGGGEYIRSLLFHQTLDRAVNAFTHKQPFWWYIPTLLYTVLPYTLLMIPAVVFLYTQRDPSDSFGRLLLTSIAVIFIMLSAFSGKLAIYLTPILPFMAYLMPKFGKMTDGRAETIKKAALLVVAAILAVGGIGILAMSRATGRDLLAPMALRLAIVTPYIFCKTILAIAATLAAGSIAAIVVICRKGWVKGAIALGAAIYLAVLAAGVTIEPLNEFTAYEKVCREAVKASDSDTYNTLYVRRPENMDVYLGCDVCDWKEDIDGFVAGDHRGEVLIVPTDLAISDTRLKEYLESREGTRVGEFSVFGL